MNQFPDILKTWRKARRLSQLDLALEADVSARHISFLETGRARPSREMIARLTAAMHTPIVAHNDMLRAAGFAPHHKAREWSDSEMTPIREAVSHMLENHAPYPALAIDRLWTVLRMNEPAARLFGLMNLSEGGSLLDLMTSDHLPPMIENWAETARHVARRLRTESVAQGGAPALDAAAAYLSRFDNQEPHPAPTGPVAPTIFNHGGVRLSLFATLAQFGTPEDVLLDDMKIELYFPADEATKAALAAFGRSTATLG